MKRRWTQAAPRKVRLGSVCSTCVKMLTTTTRGTPPTLYRLVGTRVEMAEQRWGENKLLERNRCNSSFPRSCFKHSSLLHDWLKTNVLTSSNRDTWWSARPRFFQYISLTGLNFRSRGITKRDKERGSLLSWQLLEISVTAFFLTAQTRLWWPTQKVDKEEYGVHYRFHGYLRAPWL